MSAPDEVLRQRIAAALWDFACPEKLKGEVPVPDVFVKMADAVIAELELREEVAGPEQFHATNRSARRWLTPWHAEWTKPQFTSTYGGTEPGCSTIALTDDNPNA